MKEMPSINILLSILFLFISFNISKESPSSEIKIIPDANQNATAAFVLLDDLEEETKDFYLYFKFDFEYHSQTTQNRKNKAFFKLTTEFALSPFQIQSIFLDKTLEEVNLADINNNGHWKENHIVFREQIDNEYNYYFIINNKHHEYEENNNRKTLILRILINKKQGQLTLENLFTLPEIVLESLNNKKNNNLRAPNYPHFQDPNNNQYNNYKYNHNYNYDYYHNNYYDRTYYGHHKYYRSRYYYSVFNCCIIIGFLLGQIWFVILILYCLVNRKKKTTLAVVVGNIQQQNN
jgi:hypothetical protein